MKNLLLLLIFSVTLFISCHQKNIEIYVSTSGNDSHNGSIEQPVATLEKALELIRPHAGKHSVIVYLREGIHYIDKSIIHTPEFSGSKEYPIRYSNYNNENVTVSTARILSNLDWKPYKDGIFMTKLENIPDIFDQLYVNGEKQHAARYPNYNPDIRHFNGYAADAISPDRVKNWKNPTGGVIHAMHRHEWGGYQYLIKGKDDKQELILEGGFQNNRQMGMHDEFRMVENIFEELDSPNEWYFNSEESVLYYYPPAGMELNTAVLEIPQLESILRIEGSEENTVRGIQISGIEMKHTLHTFMKTKEPLLRSDWAVYRGGTIFMEGAEDCLISNCRINNVGGNAIFVSNYNRNIIIEKNHITNVAASGICFVGSPEAVRSPAFEYNESVAFENLDREKGPLNNNYPAHCTADNNLIHNIGKLEKQVAGVQISMASHITVSNSSIYDLPRAGINISEGTWGGHVIEGNDVFNTVLETGDHGSFNSWGRDRFWNANRELMDSLTSTYPELVTLDAIETIIIRNNRWRCDHGWDIDLDDGSSNYHIYNNVCLNGGLKLREGFNRIVENNIMVNNSFHPHVWFQNSGDVFRHNIVTRPYYPIMIKYWGKEIDFNLFPDAASLSKAQEEGTDKHSAAGNPMFVNAETGDYRVEENSPAFGIGFKNFDMDQFGVKYDKLKRIAKTPTIPEFKIESETGENRIYEWLGAKLKNMSTEGERSATGMDKISGVLVIGVENSFTLKDAGLKPNDVILKYNNSQINDWKDLEKELQKSTKNAIITLTIFRDQKENMVTVNLPQ